MRDFPDETDLWEPGKEVLGCMRKVAEHESESKQQAASWFLLLHLLEFLPDFAQ